ncbi:conserved hypothetical protein [Rhodopseudomonas palustris HaA2]|uniref:Uncharacterized protein n=1 Tax=Rhodopseudomonas palustris (strain HaA2) TaxID=316058 RepID=Q2J242_RHOP2|nr:hypothetical protein [Rhodopseudomonas palustris]ABD05468.1 conserved hypothetical protein [Rhodopseudomonas palustris HaA2]
MNGTLDHIIGRDERAAPRLGAVQLARLRRLIGGYPVVVCWDGISPVPATAAAVVVLEAANAARIEMLIGSLHENAIIILPTGENPAFDLLKSKLYAHGSIGAEGAEAPHHVWWGGVKPAVVRTGVYQREDTLFITAAAPDDAAARELATDIARLGLAFKAGPLAAGLDAAAQRCAKVDFIVAQWSQADRGVFWIDPDARVAAHPLLPQASGCDFAVHRQPSGAMTTGALYFNRTDAARALLEMWQRLTHGYPDLPASFLLDQAWILIASQRQLETAWLPDDYWRVDDLTTRGHAVIVAAAAAGATTDLEPQLGRFAAPLQLGRRFSRHQAPEAHLIMTVPGAGRGPITVVVRDVLSAGARHLSGYVEAITAVFAADSGGFSQLEIVLCAWDEDIDQVLQIRDYSWVLLMDPSEPIAADIFRALPGGVGEQRPQTSRDSFGRAASPVGLVASRQAFIQRPSSAYAMTRH